MTTDIQELKNKIIGKMIVDGWNTQSANEMAVYLDLYEHAVIDKMFKMVDSMDKDKSGEFGDGFNFAISEVREKLLNNKQQNDYTDIQG